MTDSIQFGNYTLLERLAIGEVAELFRGVRRGPDGAEVPVVVKRIRDELAGDPTFSGPFLDEAKLGAALSHPNLGRVYEWGREGDSLYIAMEYIEGTNLGSVLQSASEQGVRFQPALGLTILCQVLDGLTHAHELTDAFGAPLGLVHRNVCPRNIVLAADGRVKLVDFGLAKATSRTAQTRPGLFAGGLTYLAPEVISQTAIDQRADLFSVGVVLYELLTGLKLHAQTGPEAARMVAEAVNSRPPSSVHADIPTELDQLVARATSPEPERRPVSARVFREALQVFLGRWAQKAGPEELAAYLVEVLAGRARQASGRASFAFGEATSHWFAQGEVLERLPPGEVAPGLSAATAERPDGTDPVLRAPRGGFAAGSTVMAVEAGGLGRSRTWKALAIVGGVLAVGALLIWAVVRHLADGDPAPQGPRISLDVPVEAAYSGPVALRVEPAGALAVVDGEPMKPEGDPPSLLGLRAGERRVKLVAAGYLPWEGSLSLVKDQPAELVQQLEPRKGVLKIQTTPPRAMVFLDGKKAGRSPLALKELLASRRHALRVELKGFATESREVKPEDWPEALEDPLVIEFALQKPSRNAPPRKGKKPGR
jgi:serine/threonine-protein kinase